MVLRNVYAMGFFSVDRLFTLSYNAAMPSSQDGFIAYLSAALLERLINKNHTFSVPL